jgi:hypothetical protein
MAKNFGNHELPSFIAEVSPGKYPYKGGMDHLTYLERGPSLFEHEEDDDLREWRLVFASCGHPVTAVSEKMDVGGRHHHEFPY